MTYKVHSIKVDNDHAERKATFTVQTADHPSQRTDVIANCILDSGSRHSLIGADHPLLENVKLENAGAPLKFCGAFTKESEIHATTFIFVNIKFDLEQEDN